MQPLKLLVLYAVFALVTKMQLQNILYTLKVAVLTNGTRFFFFCSQNECVVAIFWVKAQDKTFINGLHKIDNRALSACNIYPNYGLEISAHHSQTGKLS